jgi:hypothetical protein
VETLFPRNIGSWWLTETSTGFAAIHPELRSRGPSAERALLARFLRASWQPSRPRSRSRFADIASRRGWRQLARTGLHTVVPTRASVAGLRLFMQTLAASGDGEYDGREAEISGASRP